MMTAHDGLAAAAHGAVVAQQVDDREQPISASCRITSGTISRSDLRAEAVETMDVHRRSIAAQWRRMAGARHGSHGHGLGPMGPMDTLDSGAHPAPRPRCRRRSGGAPMTDDRERWALILGASSGMGEATALTLAAAGYRICGIHLDFRAAIAHVEELKAKIAAAGSEALYINMNAADDEKRAGGAGGAARAVRPRRARRAATPYVRVVMHSLAFGSLVPFLAEDPKGARRPQEDGDDPGRHGQQPRVLGPGPVARRVPRARLEDLRDDLGGLHAGRPVATASSRRRRRRSSRTSGSSRWSSRASAPASRRTRSGPASRSPRR